MGLDRARPSRRRKLVWLGLGLVVLLVLLVVGVSGSLVQLRIETGTGSRTGSGPQPPADRSPGSPSRPISQECVGLPPEPVRAVPVTQGWDKAWRKTLALTVLARCTGQATVDFDVEVVSGSGPLERRELQAVMGSRPTGDVARLDVPLGGFEGPTCVLGRTYTVRVLQATDASGAVVPFPDGAESRRARAC